MAPQAGPQWPMAADVVGVDEAGRGPWAGPVVAAAVCLSPRPDIEGLDDSKRLTPARRDALAVQIRARARGIGIGFASAAEIDRLNILAATFLAMQRALLALGGRPRIIRVDGNRLPPPGQRAPGADWEAWVRGDSRDAAIAAASIIAKTTRDAFMIGADQHWPGYDFALHKGYGTALHAAALRRLGPSPLHRLSYKPVKSVADSYATDPDPT